MAKENRQDEVFGEDFNLLEGIEDIIPGNTGDDADDNSDDAQGQGDDTGDNDEGDNNDLGDDSQQGDDPQDNNGEDTNNSDDADNNSSSPLIPYAKYLKEEGILPNFDLEKFDGSIDGLREGMYAEIIGGIEQYKATLPEPVRNLLNNYEEGVPLERLLEIDKERVKYSSYTDEDLDSEDVQKDLVREYLSKTTKFSKEKIDREITRLGDLQELADEAKTVLPELIAFQADEEKALVEQAKVSKQKAEEARLQELETLRSTLESTMEIVPGVKLSDSLRQKIYKNLTTPVGYNEIGQPLNKLGAYRAKNAVQTEIMLNYIFEVTNEFKDWSVLGRGAKRQVLSDIEKAARTLDNRTNSSNNPTFAKTQKSSQFIREIDDFLE